MASNPHVDFSDEIRAFRRMQSIALSERLPKLEYEINRIKPLLESEELKTDPIREKDLAIFINCAEIDLQAVKDFYLLHTSFQYALLKKEISTPAFIQFHDVVKDYDGAVLTSDEAASFLASSHFEIRSVFTALSHILNDISVLNDGLSCIKESNDYLSLKQSILDFINGYRDPMALCKEISAFNGSFGDLESYVLGDLDSYIQCAEEITEESYIIDKTSYSSNDVLFFSHLVYAVRPKWLKLEEYRNNADEYIRITRQAYKEALDNAIVFAAENGMINKEECDVITGTPDFSYKTQPKHDTTKEQLPFDRMPKPQVVETSLQRAAYFPFLEDVIKDENVISIIAKTAVDFALLEDDPDMVAAFKYRFTGLEELKPDADIKKINWRLNAIQEGKRHPGELLALLRVFSSNRAFRLNCKYILDYFTFQYEIQPGRFEIVDYKIPDNPQSRVSPDDNFRKELLSRFEDNEGICELIRKV